MSAIEYICYDGIHDGTGGAATNNTAQVDKKPAEVPVGKFIIVSDAKPEMKAGDEIAPVKLDPNPSPPPFNNVVSY